MKILSPIMNRFLGLRKDKRGEVKRLRRREKYVSNELEK